LELANWIASSTSRERQFKIRVLIDNHCSQPSLLRIPNAGLSGILYLEQLRAQQDRYSPAASPLMTATPRRGRLRGMENNHLIYMPDPSSETELAEARRLPTQPVERALGPDNQMNPGKMFR
jgi:hypothetical protein